MFSIYLAVIIIIITVITDVQVEFDVLFRLHKNDNSAFIIICDNVYL